MRHLWDFDVSRRGLGDFSMRVLVGGEPRFLPSAEAAVAYLAAAPEGYPGPKERVEAVLRAVADLFAKGDVPDAVQRAVFSAPNLPSSKWSLSNRLIMLWIGRTRDARGFHQWKDAGRSVKKGAHAFHILGPKTIKRRETVLSETGERVDQERVIVTGFVSIPVFRYEDTEGKPVEYLEPEMPKHPLLEVAQAWGVDVRAMGRTERAYGWYAPGEKKITLMSPDEDVFFHELAHAADHRLNGRLERGQDPTQEIVAELSAACLARLVGRETKWNGGEHFKYIAGYAQQWYPALSETEAVGRACYKVLARTGAVLGLILEAADAQVVHEEVTP